MLMERAAVLPPPYANQPEGSTTAHTYQCPPLQYETAKSPTDDSQHFCGSAEARNFQPNHGFGRFSVLLCSQKDLPVKPAEAE